MFSFLSCHIVFISVFVFGTIPGIMLLSDTYLLTDRIFFHVRELPVYTFNIAVRVNLEKKSYLHAIKFIMVLNAIA